MVVGHHAVKGKFELLQRPARAQFVRKGTGKRAKHLAARQQTGDPRQKRHLDGHPPPLAMGRENAVDDAALLRPRGPDGRLLAPGERGEIVVKGDLVMGGYHENADASAAALKDGWLHTGDVGYRDEDGYLYVVDRLKDLVISGGFNISPSEIEQVLLGHPAIADGRCNVALITLAGKPRSAGQRTGTERRHMPVDRPNAAWEAAYGWTVATLYGNLAKRHMHQYGTTSEQLAWIKVAASVHAQHNPLALLPKAVTVDDVLTSPMVADPLHRLDCCVITDGGGTLVLTRPEIAKSLHRPWVRVLGCGETVKTSGGGYADMLRTGAAQSGANAFRQAGVRPQDIQYASIYDDFTIMVLLQLEDLGFCEKSQGGRFVEDGGLIAGQGRLAWNTDGGGLCNNHPANRGGITKAIEAVRQLRGEAAAPLQVPNCSLALAAGPGGVHGLGHSHATVIMERV